MTADSTFGAAPGALLVIGGVFDDYQDRYDATITNGATGTTAFAGDSSSFGGNITVTAGYLLANTSSTWAAPPLPARSPCRTVPRCK